jgi:acyl-CoA dehydrogenase
MDFSYPERVLELQRRVQTFMDDHVVPANPEWQRVADGGEYPMAIIEDLKTKARREGLWNLFLPGLRDDEPGIRLDNLEYAPLAEIMGRVPW